MIHSDLLQNEICVALCFDPVWYCNSALYESRHLGTGQNTEGISNALPKGQCARFICYRTDASLLTPYSRYSCWYNHPL